jgi:hypothetical protein
VAIEKLMAHAPGATDTWINPRWQQYEALMDEYRAWLGELPTALARRIAWGNGAALFALQS